MTFSVPVSEWERFLLGNNFSSVFLLLFDILSFFFLLLKSRVEVM